MLKWIVGAIVLVALAVGFVRLQRNAVKTSYVNGLPLYTDLPGQEFIFERDCYVFEFRDRSSDWPLVGTHLTVPLLPAEVDPAKVGADLPGVRILGLARIGDRFRIVSVRRDESRQGTTITFEILFMDETARPYPRLDAYWIMDHAPEKRGRAPSILLTYAVPRVKD
jgi:hypothetical protein